ncbi:MAG: YciI family protein [Sandaracinus sp.]|nr:hypothetical protein [Myxococcales bacterium]MCB9603276.1 YciI family protein [Sandaracinus sp.]MCB9613236.1 YciI family protein [Sandaracinus sp.]
MSDKTTYALLIYRVKDSRPGQGAREETLEGHRALQKEAHAAGDLHAVARLDLPDRVKTVYPDTGVVTDGPFVESKEWLAGFYLVDCATEDEAVARARLICCDPDHVVVVRPAIWRWQP